MAKMKLERGSRCRAQKPPDPPPHRDITASHRDITVSHRDITASRRDITASRRDITAFGDRRRSVLSPLLSRTRAPINPTFLVFGFWFCFCLVWFFPSRLPIYFPFLLLVCWLLFFLSHLLTRSPDAPRAAAPGGFPSVHLTHRPGNLPCSVLGLLGAPGSPGSQPWEERKVGCSMDGRPAAREFDSPS